MTMTALFIIIFVAAAGTLAMRRRRKN